MGGTPGPCRLWHGVLCILVALANMGNADSDSAPQIRLSPFESQDGGEPTRSFCPPSLMSPSSSKAATAICNMRGPEFYNGSAADLLMAARFGGSMTYGAGLWNLSNPKARSPYTTEPNIPNIVADYVVEYNQEQNKWNSARRIKAVAQVDLLLCSNDNCDTVADIWNHDEYTVAMGFTTLLGSNSGIPQGFITPDTHNVQPTVVPAHLSKDVSGANVYQVQWGSKSTDTNNWLNKQAWGTKIPPGLVPKIIRTLSRVVINMTEQRVRDDWRQAYSKTVLAPDMMQFGAMSALLAANNDKLRYISYAVVSARVLARARGVDPEAAYFPLGDNGNRDTEGAYGMPVTDECVVVIFPNFSWMSQHGWGHFVGDPCMRRLASDNASSMPIYIFDSYFYQSQYFWTPTWLGYPLRRDVLQNSTFSTLVAGYTSDYCDKSHAGSACYDFRVNVSSHQPWELLRENNKGYMHQAESDVYATTFDAEKVLVRTDFGHLASSTAPQGFVPWRDKQMDPHQGLGHYGITLMCASNVSANSMLKQPCEVVTQAAAGCFTDCNADVQSDGEIQGAVWYDCGGCAALQVGGASIAAWELTTTGSILLPHAEAVPNADRLLQLTEVAKWDSKTTPWCIDFYGETISELLPLIAELEGKVPNDMMGTLKQAEQSPSSCLYGYPSTEVGRCSQVAKIGLRPVYLEYQHPESYRNQTFFGHAAFRSTQCDIWDELGIGVVGSTNAAGGNESRSKGSPTAYPLWDLLRVQLHNISSDVECLPVVSHGPQCFTPFAGCGQLHPSLLNQAMGTVVRDAQMLLIAKAQSELATMDTTKTWSGALIDTSVIFVAIVAVASGLRDLVALVHDVCNKVPPTKPLPGCITTRCSAEFRQWCDGHTINELAATGLSCVLVLLGLMTAPIVTIVSEQMARDSNADGKSSDLAWSAVDTDSGTGPYTVLAAVSVTLTAEYDHAAERLNWFNLGLAAVATLYLWYKILKPPNQGTIVLSLPCIARTAQSLWQFVVRAFKLSIDAVSSFGRRFFTKSTSKSPNVGCDSDGVVIAMEPLSA